MKGRIVLALSLVVACKHAAPQTVPPPVMDPGPSNPPGPIVVTPLPTSSKLRFGPSATRYVIQQRVRFEHDRPDMPPVTELGWRTFIASTITGPAESAGYPASFTVDSILPDSGVVLPPWMDLNAGRGLRFNGHLAPTGEFQGRAVDTLAASKLAMLIGGFRNFYPRIPPAGVAEGDSWTDTLTLSDTASSRRSVRKSIRRVRAAAWEDTPAGRVLRLEVNEQFEQTESGSGGGQPFEAKGSGIGASVERIGAAGKYLGAIGRDSANLVITLPAQGITIPRRQYTSTIVTVLP